MKTVLVYGDSNSHGAKPMVDLDNAERFARGLPWPDVMAAELGADVHVICEGLPGRTTVHEDLVGGGMRNGLSVLPAILHSHKPIDLLVILLGTNDLKNQFSVTSYEIVASVQRLVLAARAEGVVKAEMIICPPPVVEAGVLAPMFEGAMARQHDLAIHMEQVATRLGCGFFDAARHITVSPIDGVHWEEGSHDKMGRAIAGPVADMLAQL